MTAPKRGRGRPTTPSSTHHSESVEVRLTPALRASLEADAAAARLTLSDLCRARLGATGEDEAAARTVDAIERIRGAAEANERHLDELQEQWHFAMLRHDAPTCAYLTSQQDFTRAVGKAYRVALSWLDEANVYDADGALRAAYLAGYRAGVREAGARVEALGREAPGPEVVR